MNNEILRLEYIYNILSKTFGIIYGENMQKNVNPETIVVNTKQILRLDFSKLFKMRILKKKMTYIVSSENIYTLVYIASFYYNIRLISINNYTT